MASFADDTVGLQAASHSFIADLEAWQKEIIRDRPEAVLLASALSEYQFGLLAVVQGQYRQAFMALRLALELLLGTVFLSANELELRIWLRGQRDIVWSSLVDADSGPLSKKFAKAFYEELAEEAPHYRTMAEKVYRECSEFVHGNAQAKLGGTLIYQPTVFRDWHSKAKTIRLVASFALCVRYVRLADSSTCSRLEAVLMENLGHLAAIRVLLGAPAEPLNG